MQQIKRKNELLWAKLQLLKSLGFSYSDDQVFKEDVAPFEPNKDSLESLNTQIQQCHLCELSKHRKRVLCGIGKREAVVMFVGNVPNLLDENNGKIFSGNYGMMIEGMAKNVLGLKEEEYYLSTLLRCTPPSANSFDISKSYEACLGYLKEEIRLIEPKVIICLGQEPLEYLLKKPVSLHEAHGTPIPYDQSTIIPMQHPSFIARNPDFKKEAYRDLLVAKTLI